MSIGIIYCGYNSKSYVKDTINPFISLKDKLHFNISAVSLPFLEYFEVNKENDGTTEFLVELYNNNKIDNVFTGPSYIQEHKARDLCLQYLKVINSDLIWLVDADEFYTQKDIENILAYVNSNSEYYWYSINFKNYIFDGKQWIDGFCPPRIFRTKFYNEEINEFYWDNDIIYKDKNSNAISYKNLSNLNIPKDIAHIKHLTWLHTNGKDKYEYQMKHFGHCGYKWNYETNQLELNHEFYVKNKIDIPKIINE
jgi:hypothetical protein